mgnify:FL=1
MTICTECKWGVIGRYSQIYKGCPIGCKKPNDKRNYGKTVANGGFGNCFEPKEKINDSNN